MIIIPIALMAAVVGVLYGLLIWSVFESFLFEKEES